MSQVTATGELYASHSHVSSMDNVKYSLFYQREFLIWILSMIQILDVNGFP